MEFFGSLLSHEILRLVGIILRDQIAGADRRDPACLCFCVSGAKNTFSITGGDNDARTFSKVGSAAGHVPAYAV